MNISVVKRKNPFYIFFDFVSSLFKIKSNKYILVPATTSLNYIDRNYIKTDIDIEKIEKQNIQSVKELVSIGELNIAELTLEEIEELNQLYIEENKNLSASNIQKKDKLKNKTKNKRRIYE